jgi:hypothetical protein
MQSTVGGEGSDDSMDAILNSYSENAQDGEKIPHQRIGFFTAKIKTGLPNKEDIGVLKKIYDVAHLHYKENSDPKFIMFSKKPKVDGCWPVCTLSMRDSDASETSRFMTVAEKKAALSQRKVLAAQLPPFTDGKSIPYYFFFKEAFRFTHPLKLSQSGLDMLVEKADVIYNYLNSIDNQALMIGEKLKNRPDPIILEEIDEKTRIVLQVDDNQLQRENQYTFIPNISIRRSRLTRDGTKWYFEKEGITIQPSTFFYMIEGTVKRFLFEIKDLVGEVREVFQENIHQLEMMKQEMSQQ